MVEVIERSRIEAVLAIARCKKRIHEDRPLSEAYIEAITAIDCFEYVLSLCKPLNNIDEIKLKNLSS